MNYRHAYHAGNFADVFKHIVLIALVESFLKKDTGFCYLDTHAGSGQYDLFLAAAQKSKEFNNGITRVMQQAHPPSLVQRYLNCVKAFNESDTLRFYPGSPSIVQQFCRSQDRLVLCELHQEEWQLLKTIYAQDKRVAIHHQDGYLGLKAFLPPKERRGLILIDPPYEKPDELSHLVKSLSLAFPRFETGVYAIWYPIKLASSTQRFQQALKRAIDHPVLIAECTLYPNNSATQLNGSGIAVINPPWQLDETLKSVLPWLWQTLSPYQQGYYQVQFL